MFQKLPYVQFLPTTGKLMAHGTFEKLAIIYMMFDLRFSWW
jgi:hypothetical protein